MTDRKPQTQEKFIVRLPEGLRDRIKIAADANGRSMNAEIVNTLLAVYPKPAIMVSGSSLEEIIELVLKDGISRQMIDGSKTTTVVLEADGSVQSTVSFSSDINHSEWRN